MSQTLPTRRRYRPDLTATWRDRYGRLWLPVAGSPTLTRLAEGGDGRDQLWNTVVDCCGPMTKVVGA